MKNSKFLILALCFTFFGVTAQAKNTTPFTTPLTVATDTTALVEYKGKYNFSNDAPVTEVTIVIEKEELMAKSDQGNFPLKPVDKQADNFTIEAINAEVIFSRNEEKKIIGISVKMPDGTIVGKKEN